MSEAENQPSQDQAAPVAEMEGAAPGKVLSPAAKRALAEAAERRAKEAASEHPAELGGPSGPEPTRYGDWERGGRAVDF